MFSFIFRVMVRVRVAKTSADISVSALHFDIRLNVLVHYTEAKIKKENISLSWMHNICSNSNIRPRFFLLI